MASDILARQVPRRQRPLDHDVISIHIDTVEIAFLNQAFSLAETRVDTGKDLNSLEEVEEPESGESEHDTENIWNVIDMHRSSEHSMSALEGVKSLCESLSLPVPTKVVEKRQHIESTIQTFADYRWLEASVEMTDAVLAATEENWKQNLAVYGEVLVDFSQEVNKKSTNISKLEELFSTVSDL